MENKKGFMRFETLTILFVVMVLLVGGVYVIVKNGSKENFNVMKKDAYTFAMSGSGYLYDRDVELSYLVELIDSSFFKEIKNPTKNKKMKYCDKYESKITLRDNVKYVTLQCGDYLISDQVVDGEKYRIYKIGEWQEDVINGDVEVRDVYNYDKSGVAGFDKYYEEGLFIYMFNKSNHTSYSSIDEIRGQYNVLLKTMYRTRKLVAVE